MPLRKTKGKAKKKKGGKKSLRMSKNISCMAFNKDNTKIAIGVGKEVWIFTNGGEDEPLTELARSKWVKAHVLAAHDLEVSGVDWCHNSDKIITCSHDRNAFVWTKKSTGEWVQGLVILRITRAALAAKWSPKGNKFAVTSGAKRVPICRFEKTDDWWIPEMISKHKSSVVALDWHPNNTVIATGSTDFRCRVISAYLSKVDGDHDHAPFEDGSFGTVLAEFECKGWVMDVAFSPDGDRLSFVGHDSSVTIVDCSTLDQHTTKTNILPFTAILFIDETNIIAGGHNFAPFKVSAAAGEAPVLGDSIDTGKTEEKKTKKTKSAAKAAMDKFKNVDTLGKETAVAALNTKHQAAITCMRSCGSHFATAGEDGRVVFWKL